MTVSLGPPPFGCTSSSTSVGLFVAENPERILDTRTPGQGRLWPGWVVEGGVPDPWVASVQAFELPPRQPA